MSVLSFFGSSDKKICPSRPLTVISRTSTPSVTMLSADPCCIYDVVLEYPEERYNDITALIGHPIATQSGRLVTLEDIADIQYTTTLPGISRQDGQFITTVTATTSEAAKYTAADGINAAVAELDFPDGVAKAQSAQDKMSNDEIGNMSQTLLIAIFLVFLVMAVQFDSPRLSIMIMLCIPFSLAGSFGFLLVAGRPMSIMGIMGFLMLFGIVVNNGILLVDATNQMRKTMPRCESLPVRLRTHPSLYALDGPFY